MLLPAEVAFAPPDTTLDTTGPPAAATLVSSDFKSSSLSAAPVFTDVLVIESKVRPRIRLVLWGVSLFFVSTATDPTAAGSGVEPPLFVKPTVVLVLGLEVARGASLPEPANRNQMLETDSFLLLILQLIFSFL